jgi:hypothetical protein
MQNIESGLSLTGLKRHQIPQNPESNPSDIALYFINETDSPNSFAVTQAFFYGNKNIFRDVMIWLSDKSEFDTQRMMLLTLDDNGRIVVDLGDVRSIGLLVNDALLLATENGLDHGVETVVTLLLNNQINNVPNQSGQALPHLSQ